MVNRVQSLRSSTPGARPTGRTPGELYVNFPELMLGVVNAANLAQDLLAIRFFSMLADYVVGDYVIEAGRLYRAIVNVTRGAFNPAQWEVNLMIDDAGGLLAGYLPLSGGTLTGALTLAADAAAALEPVTFQQLVTLLGSYLPLTGGALAGPGNLDIAGVLTVTGPNSVLLNGAAAQPRGILGGTAGAARWQLLLADATAETGANAGSNFQLNAFADVGGPLSTPLAIERATGRVALTNDLSIVRPSGSTRSVLGRTGAAARWEMQLGGPTPETGANAGSNFNLLRYDDTGVLIPGASPLTINRATGVATFANVSAPQVIGDNRIINGDMRIDQRYNGLGGLTANGYFIDRWQFSASLATRGTFGRTAGTPPIGFIYSAEFISNSASALAAGDFFSFLQVIEAEMIYDFRFGLASAQPITLSFYAFSTLAGTFAGAIRNFGPPANRSYVFTYTLPASAWTYITVTIPGDTAGTWVMSGNAPSMYVSFPFGTGTTFQSPTPNAWVAGNFIGAAGTVNVIGTNGARFDVTGVKLEIGSVATPFNHDSLAKSMADCQRYFQKLGGSGTNIGEVIVQGYAVAGGAGQSVSSTVGTAAMRATPTATIVGTLTNTNVATQVLFPGRSSLGIQLQPTAAGLVGSYTPATTTTYISLNAEI